MNHHIRHCIIAALCAISAACASPERKAAELLDTARFEEKQNNYIHAEQLYREILAAYGTTAAAGDAARHLDELRKRRGGH